MAEQVMSVPSEVSEWSVTIEQNTELVEVVDKRARMYKVVLLAAHHVGRWLKVAGCWRSKHSREVIHGLKLGLAVTLVSLTYYVTPLYQDVGASAMAAILTVAAIFERQVGGTIYRGFTEASANLIAGALAIGFHYLAIMSGEKAEPIIRGGCIFLLASVTTLARYTRRVRVLFEDGMVTFIIIFIMFLVSGYRDNDLVKVAQQRACSLAIGCSVGVLICVIICPVWAGSELHLFVTHNLEILANSLEGSVAEYFNDTPLGDQQMYKGILNSKASEESLVNFARWEPAHGRFRFRHPWKQYLKLGAEIRSCARSVEALHGCISSEIQAPELLKQQLRAICIELSMRSSKILKELAVTIKFMTKSLSMDLLVADMNCGIKELQLLLISLPKQQALLVSGAKDAPLVEVVLLINFGSLLIESSERIKGLIDAVEELARLASFKSSKNKCQTEDSIC